MKLADLGPRICIVGPSGSGKSTLAVAIGQHLGGPVIHLDRLFHRPDSDWVPRPFDDFAADHAAAVNGATWVTDGNYTRLLQSRLARATGLILLDAPIAVSFGRYFRRSWLERHRAGGLMSGRDSVKWSMIRHIVIAGIADRRRYAAFFDAAHLPKVRLTSSVAIASFYRTEGLTR